MTLDEIQARLDRIATLMGGCGFTYPHAEFALRSNETPKVFARHGDVASWSFYFAKGATISEQMDDLDAWANALPTPDEHHRQVFLRKAADAADYAAQHLPADTAASEVRASIVGAMQRLSENAIGKVA